MVSVSDILNLLDKIPAWKKLNALPEKVAALEKRIEELEQALSVPPGNSCPKCHVREFELVESRPHPLMGEAGVVEHIYKCGSCGFSEAKVEYP